MEKENWLLDIKALAPILCLAPRTLRNKLCAAPDTLPPCVKVPGTKGPRWRWSDVQTWINTLPASDAVTATDVPRSRPGRRRNAVH